MLNRYSRCLDVQREIMGNRSQAESENPSWQLSHHHRRQDASPRKIAMEVNFKSCPGNLPNYSIVYAGACMQYFLAW